MSRNPTEVRNTVKLIKHEIMIQLETMPDSEVKKRLITLLNNIAVTHKLNDSPETVACYISPSKIAFYSAGVDDDFYYFKNKGLTLKEYLTCVLAHEIGHAFDKMPKHLISGNEQFNSSATNFFINKLNTNIEMMDEISKSKVIEIIEIAFVKSHLSKYLSSEHRANINGSHLINVLFPENERIKFCFEQFFKKRIDHENYIMNKYFWDYYDEYLNLDYIIKKEVKSDLILSFKKIITDYSSFKLYNIK